MNRLSGKTVLVTAGGAGIGRATARAFAAEGVKVLATDIDSAALASLKDEAAKLDTAILDVCSDDAVAAALAVYSPRTNPASPSGLPT